MGIDENMKPTPPQTTWDLLQPMMEHIKGAAWSTEDIACVHNFLKLIGDPHVDFLVSFAPFVEFDTDLNKLCRTPQTGRTTPRSRRAGRQ